MSLYRKGIGAGREPLFKSGGPFENDRTSFWVVLAIACGTLIASRGGIRADLKRGLWSKK